jgi:signal peptidase II
MGSIGSMQDSPSWFRSPLVRAGLVLITIFFCDQLTKSAVNASILPGTRHRVMRGIELVDIRDHEFVLGFIPVGAQTRMLLGVLGLLVAFVVCIRYFRRYSGHPMIWLPVGLMLGGGLGNMFDLLSQGSATDFIELPSSRVVFNLADAAVMIGMLMLIYLRMLRALPGARSNTQAAS